MDKSEKMTEEEVPKIEIEPNNYHFQLGEIILISPTESCDELSKIAVKVIKKDAVANYLEADKTKQHKRKVLGVG